MKKELYFISDNFFRNATKFVIWTGDRFSNPCAWMQRKTRHIFKNYLECGAQCRNNLRYTTSHSIYSNLAKRFASHSLQTMRLQCPISLHALVGNRKETLKDFRKGFTSWSYFWQSNRTCTPQKMKFSINDFYSLGLQLYYKRDSDTGLFLWIL